MPAQKYSNQIALNEQGRWVATLKNKRFAIDFPTLDDAVDAILMEESFACARIASERAAELRAGGTSVESAIVELEAIAERIRARAEQEFAA